MSNDSRLDDVSTQLEQLDYGKRGLTRNDMRAQMPDLPDVIYLHLPDSKRFLSAAEVLHEVRSSAARAEGEFVAAGDDTPDDAAEGDFGPAGYGGSPLVSPTVVGPTGNTPVAGFDGNSLETEEEFSESE
jgi:hypothetical protein